MQPASLGTQLHVWWRSLPLGTRGILVLCCGVWVAEIIIGVTPASVCTGPSLLLSRWQVWRMATSAFSHASFLHLLMNMLALISLAPPVEMSHGTCGLILLALAYAVTSQVIAITPPALLHVAGIDQALGLIAWRECAVGLSGVLFALLTLDVTDRGLGISRNLCGFHIPAAAYPWVLLVLLQILMPSASFLMHLGGIISSMYVITPNGIRRPAAYVEHFVPQAVKGQEAFVPVNTLPMPHMMDNTIWGRFTSAGRHPATSSSAPPSKPAAEKFPGKGRVVGVGSPEETADDPQAQL